MMPDLLKTRFTLHAQLAVHRRRVDRARARVGQWLERTTHPYIAYSGGKDSGCVMALVREQALDTPAVYFDAQCAYPEVDDILNATPKLINQLADEPFLATLLKHHLSQSCERATMESTVDGPVRRLLETYGFDGVAYGLRAEESLHRKRHARYRGAIFQYKRDHVWGCQPIHDWEYNDVWAFTITRNMPYCALYDLMWELPESEQRVGYWAGETNRQRGRYTLLKRYHLELWNQLCAIIPESTIYG